MNCLCPKAWEEPKEQKKLIPKKTHSQFVLQTWSCTAHDLAKRKQIASLNIYFLLLSRRKKMTKLYLVANFHFIAKQESNVVFTKRSHKNFVNPRHLGCFVFVMIKQRICSLSLFILVTILLRNISPSEASVIQEYPPQGYRSYSEGENYGDSEIVSVQAPNNATRIVLEVEDTIEFCHEVGDRVFLTTEVPKSKYFFYLLQGAKQGNCVDMCKELCSHKSCHDDLYANSGRCICKRRIQPLCGSNTRCVNDTCRCIPGYFGNPAEGCSTGEIRFLYQKDFNRGTVVLDISGKYMLAEDITFCPTVRSKLFRDIPSDSFQPMFPGDGEYDEYAFALGFSSAIAIIGDNIEIYLNGKTMQQCDGHLLMQRFFSLIGLALQPFTENEGPHNFVNPNIGFRAGQNIAISGPGKLGRTSHHGIFGNLNSNVHIKNIEFEGFEVAAIHFNQIDGLVIEDCTILGTRQDVPIMGIFSSGVFMRPYLKALMKKDYSMTLRNQAVSARELYNRLSISIKNVYDDVLKNGKIDRVKHMEESLLFGNPLGIPEGSCYGIVIYGHGPASHGFAVELEDETKSSKNITIRNNKISSLKCFTKEYPTVVNDGQVIVDARGAVFQFRDTMKRRGLALNSTDGSYAGNVVSDAQVMVAKAILDGTLPSNDAILQTKLNTIPQTIISWAEGIPVGDPPVKPMFKPLYRCHGDAMHHVSKGIVAIRIEESLGFTLNNNVIANIENVSPSNFRKCSDFHKEADQENGIVKQAANIRAISVGASRRFLNGTQSEISNNVISDCFSPNANSIVGIDVQGDTKGIDITENIVNLDQNSKSPSSVYSSLIIGENADDRGASTTISIDNNMFYQPSTVQNYHPLRRNLRIISDTGVPGVPNGGIHNKIVGLKKVKRGCPFSQ